MTAATASLATGMRQRRLLGYLGLLPFVGCLGVMLLADDRSWQNQAAAQLVNYSALIASFLGAVHWGDVAHAGRRRLGIRLAWGVTPALLAWTLLGLPPDIALAGFTCLFAVILLVDCYLLLLLDEDYRQLRVRLSAVVITCLLVAAIIHPGITT